MTNEHSPKPETDANGAQSKFKEAMSVRLKAFAAMDNTRIYRERRFAFLAVGAAAVMIAAISLPKDKAEPVIEEAMTEFGTEFKNEMKKTLRKARAYQKKNYYAGNWKPEYEKLLIPFKGQINGPDYEVVAWNAALTYAPIFEDNIVVKIPKIKAKTVLIIGTRDRTGPGRGWMRKGIKRKLGQYQELGKDLKRTNPKLKLVELKGLGHMPQFEDYKRFAKVFFREF